MSFVIPAVIPESKAHLLQTLALFSAFTKKVQVDIVDGVFAPSASWPYTEGGALADVLSEADFGALDVELDLMIQSPEKTIEMWANTGAARIVVHLESTNDLEEIFAHTKAHQYRLGIALNNDTPLETLFAIDPNVYEYVELMGIAEIGAQGQPFDERVLDRIRKIKTEYPDLEISIDGSVNEATLPLLKDAGAERFVAGSAILKVEDPVEMYKKLSRLAGE